MYGYRVQSCTHDEALKSMMGARIFRTIFFKTYAHLLDNQHMCSYDGEILERGRRLQRQCSLHSAALLMLSIYEFSSELEWMLSSWFVFVVLSLVVLQKFLIPIASAPSP